MFVEPSNFPFVYKGNDPSFINAFILTYTFQNIDF